jgi:hypothetical protein
VITEANNKRGECARASAHEHDAPLKWAWLGSYPAVGSGLPLGMVELAILRRLEEAPSVAYKMTVALG